MAQGAPRRPRATPAVVVSTPYFKLLLFINAGLCLVTLGIMLAYSWHPIEPPPTLHMQVFSTCEKVFTMTAGAFIGLLGGKAGSAEAPK